MSLPEPMSRAELVKVTRPQIDHLLNWIVTQQPGADKDKAIQELNAYLEALTPLETNQLAHALNELRDLFGHLLAAVGMIAMVKIVDRMEEKRNEADALAIKATLASFGTNIPASSN